MSDEKQMKIPINIKPEENPSSTSAGEEEKQPANNEVSDNEAKDNNNEGTDSPSSGAAAAIPQVDLSSEIIENNKDLTAQIANAMQLSTSISGVTAGVPAGTQAPGLLNLEHLLPRIATTSTGNARTAPPAAPVQAALTPADLSLLSLLSSSNFLSPSELALPLNDPSLFLPTPFAPGQNANTVQRHTAQAPIPSVPVAAIAPIAAAAIPAVFATLPAALPVVTSIQQITTLPNPAAAALPQQQLLQHAAALPQQQLLQHAAALPQQQLLQQLAAAYGVRTDQLGGLSQAAIMGGLNPQSQALLNAGLNAFAVNPGAANPLNPTADLSLLGVAGIQGPLNPGLAGLADTLNPAGPLNPGLAGLAGALNPASLAGLGAFSGLNPGLAAAAGGLNLPGMPISAVGMNNPLLAGQQPFYVTNSSGATSPNTSLLMQEHFKQMAYAAAPQISAASGVVGAAMAEGDQKAAGNSKKKKASPALSQGGEPLIKSREARWIIRYNELLDFRREHGHCRVPHGYSPNRKLSWWVMNQRAQFAHRNEGKKTWLTDDRIQLLNDIGFIWTPHLKKMGGEKKKAAKAVSEDPDEDMAREEGEDAVMENLKTEQPEYEPKKDNDEPGAGGTTAV